MAYRGILGWWYSSRLKFPRPSSFIRRISVRVGGKTRVTTGPRTQVSQTVTPRKHGARPWQRPSRRTRDFQKRKWPPCRHDDNMAMDHCDNVYIVPLYYDSPLYLVSNVSVALEDPFWILVVNFVTEYAQYIPTSYFQT